MLNVFLVFLAVLVVAAAFIKLVSSDTTMRESAGFAILIVAGLSTFVLPGAFITIHEQAKDCATITERQRLLQTIEEQIAEWERLTSKAQTTAASSLPSRVLVVVNEDRPASSAVESYHDLLTRRARVLDEIVLAYRDFRTRALSPVTSWFVGDVECPAATVVASATEAVPATVAAPATAVMPITSPAEGGE